MPHTEGWHSKPLFRPGNVAWREHAGLSELQEGVFHIKVSYTELQNGADAKAE